MSVVAQNGDSREVLVGVTGGIAAYKTVVLVSRLVSNGFGVSVVMTKSATQLIAPKTFEALTKRSVHSETFDNASSHLHIELARAAKVFCIAPATANILAKAANGIADDLVSTLCLSFDGTLIFAPAMNSVMWQKLSVQRNVKQLKEDGAKIIEPNTGRLSCGEIGVGRMAEPETIFETITSYLTDGKE